MIKISNTTIVPIIIIGAPRSGTNILRETLTTIKNVGTWACDEIPYIWLYGNKKHPTDLLTTEMVTPYIKKYISDQFVTISNKIKKDYIIEKTCANSLRVDFIDIIFPRAKYIYIIRNGLDVTYSIMQRWNSTFSLSYTLKKLKYVPKLDIPYYCIEFFKNRYFKKKEKNRLKFWGPRFVKEEEMSGLSLEEISAKQWVACVERSNESFRKINSKRVFRLTYEEFVTNPQKQIEKMSKFIGVSIDDKVKFPAVNNASIGKGVKKLSSSQIELIKPIINKTMYDNNYSCS